MGVNKYKLAEAEQVDVLCIDNKEVREKQLARLQKTRASRDQGKVSTPHPYTTDIPVNKIKLGFSLPLF